MVEYSEFFRVKIDQALIIWGGCPLLRLHQLYSILLEIWPDSTPQRATKGSQEMENVLLLLFNCVLGTYSMAVPSTISPNLVKEALEQREAGSQEA